MTENNCIKKLPAIDPVKFCALFLSGMLLSCFFKSGKDLVFGILLSIIYSLISLTDIYYRRVPNCYIILYFLLACWSFLVLPIPVSERVLTFAAVSAVLLSFKYFVSYRGYDPKAGPRRKSIGFGDIKFLMITSLIFGIKTVFPGLLFSAAAAILILIVGVAMKKQIKKMYISLCEIFCASMFVTFLFF